MLVVKARAGPSKIHRFGLIAGQFIPCGTIVWKFEPKFDVTITESRFKRLSPIAQEQVIYYAYYHKALRTFVLSSDDDRFTNHSDDPNTRSRDDYTYAVRDIEEGQEITNDYRELVMLNFRPNRNAERQRGGRCFDFAGVIVAPAKPRRRPKNQSSQRNPSTNRKKELKKK